MPDVTDCSKCPGSAAVQQKCTSNAERPHTATQTAGFIHRLDKLCRRPHQLQPVSYPFTGCLHWWPDYSEQDTVKGTGAACWRSALRNADTKTRGGERDRTRWFRAYISGGKSQLRLVGCKDEITPKNRDVKLMMPIQILSLRLEWSSEKMTVQELQHKELCKH